MAMEISNTYNSYANTYANGTGSKKAASNREIDAKTSAPDYLAELQKKNPKLNILTGYSNGSAGSSNYSEKIDVTIAPEFLEKAASDPKLAAEYEKNLADIPSACKWGESMIRAMTGDTVYEFRFYIDENGNMSAGSVSGPSKKREIFEHSRQRAKQQKEDYAKRIEKRIETSAEKKEKTEKQKQRNTISKLENAIEEGLKNHPPKIIKAEEKKIEISDDIMTEKTRRLEEQLREGTFKTNSHFDAKA